MVEPGTDGATSSDVPDSSDVPESAESQGRCGRGPAPSEAVRVRREAHKADYDRSTIDAVLDAALVAHVGVVGADGRPVVIPTAFARIGNEVVLHGSVASRLLRTAASAPICVTVTLLDAMVVARSTFQSSMRYRSVVVMGTPRAVTDPEERVRALTALSEHLIPGRTAEVRPMSDVELRQTAVLALALDEASAKVSIGFSDDPDDDVGSSVWAGVVPLVTTWGDPVPAPDLSEGVDLPNSIRSLAQDDRFIAPESA